MHEPRYKVASDGVCLKEMSIERVMSDRVPLPIAEYSSNVQIE